MTDPDTDPYTAYYEFDPVFDDTGDTADTADTADAADRQRPPAYAAVLHELGLAGSPCRERTWGTKVEVRCPGCGTTGKVVRWDGAENRYACADCEAVFGVPDGTTDERPTRRGGRPARRAPVR